MKGTLALMFWMLMLILLTASVKCQDSDTGYSDKTVRKQCEDAGGKWIKERATCRFVVACDPGKPCPPKEPEIKPKQKPSDPKPSTDKRA